MKVRFLFSTIDGNPLRTGLARGLRALGHTVVEGVEDCDLLLIFNQTAHQPGYAYPEFPTAIGQRAFAFIDSAEYGWRRRLPAIAKDYWNTFTEASLSHDTKNQHEQMRLKHWLEGKSFPYFIREFHKSVCFPENYHPIDYPLHEGSGCDERPNREEYLRRELDLFVSWGFSHPWREHITQALRECNVKSEIQPDGKGGWDALPQPEYFRRTRLAKCSVSFDGYGSSSFRLTEILTRCLLLCGPLSIDRHAPLLDGVHCLDYAVDSAGEDYVGTNVCKILRTALADPEGAFKIYEAGYHHCMAHYTEKATAEYVLRTVEAHDWSKKTPLDNPA